MFNVLGLKTEFVDMNQIRRNVALQKCFCWCINEYIPPGNLS